MTHVMNPVVGAIFLCGVMATVMSCAAGGLNTAVSSIVRDLWRNVNPQLDELKAGRIASFVIMVLSLIFALILPDVVGWLAIGFTLMGVSLFIPTVFMVATKGYPSKWATSQGAFWSALIAGGVCVVWQILSKTVGAPYADYNPVFLGYPVALVVFLVVSRLTPENESTMDPVQRERLHATRKIFEKIKPTFAMEGWGTIVFFLSTIFAIWVLPKLFLLL
jgi:Na+/proline symporter